MDTAGNEAYELVDGELIPLPSHTPLECFVRNRLGPLIWSYLERNPIGPAICELDCRIAADRVRRPDLSIFIGDRWRALDLERTPAPAEPDIAIEVISPSEHLVDVSRKIRDYLSAGVQEVWLLDPENSEVHVRAKVASRVLSGNETLESSLLPGFTVGVATLLAGR